MPAIHQFIERDSGRIRTEPLFADRLVRMLYHPIRENAELLFRVLTGPRASKALAWLNYDVALGSRVLGNRQFLKECGIDFAECIDPRLRSRCCNGDCGSATTGPPESSRRWSRRG